MTTKIAVNIKPRNPPCNKWLSMTFEHNINYENLSTLDYNSSMLCILICSSNC